VRSEREEENITLFLPPHKEAVSGPPKTCGCHSERSEESNDFNQSLNSDSSADASE
jgi:hypothetical protein